MRCSWFLVVDPSAPDSVLFLLRITAEVVRALALADPFVSVSHQLLSDSVSWLIRRTQQADGSFSENSSFKRNKFMVSSLSPPPPPLRVPGARTWFVMLSCVGLQAEGGDKEEQSVLVTSIVLMALCQASSTRNPTLQLQVRPHLSRCCGLR